MPSRTPLSQYYRPRPAGDGDADADEEELPHLEFGVARVGVVEQAPEGKAERRSGESEASTHAGGSRAGEHQDQEEGGREK